MKVSNTSLLLSIFFLIGITSNLLAQTDKELLAELAAEEEEAINALVLYPADTRQAILEATLYPEALIRMESIQNKTSTAFREIMQSHPLNSQQILWDLTRYPGLVHQLANLRLGSDNTIEAVLDNYPNIIHKRAREASANHDLPLVMVDQLDQSAESAFKTILEEYPLAIQGSLQELTTLPEVLTILTENIRLTLLVGHVYEKHPDWMLQKADSLNLEVTRQNAQEVADWKASLKNDPEAMKELTASINTYNEEYGYDDDYYNYDEEEAIFEETNNEVIIRHHYYYSYPYWLGYPYWYSYPRWHYYPSWYDWGFYQTPNQSIIFIGLPSFHFTHWFFYNSHHHYRYSHLSAHFVKHYHGHRRSGSSISTSVNNWHHRNRAVISNEWMKDDGRLSKRFKEYSEFESSREKYNKQHPKQKVSQQDYVSRNDKKYPALSNSKKEQEDQTKNQSRINVKPDKPSFKKQTEKNKKPKVDKPSTKQPKIQKDQTKKPVNPKIKRPEVKKKTPKTSPKKKKTTRKPNSKNLKAPKVKRGKNYHKNTWSKTKRTKPQRSTRPNSKRTPQKVKPKVSRKKSGGGK